MTLQEIKDKWADEKGWSSWENMRDHYEGEAIDTMIDTIAQVYARECVKASLEKAAENDYDVFEDENAKIYVAKKSITIDANIVLL